VNYAESKNWTSTDGHRFTSVPTEIPGTPWKIGHDGQGRRTYTSGAYMIVRTVVSGGTNRTYEVFRDGEELPLSFTGRFRWAEERAVRNARGLDVMNVA
jgi:hypothetical protein